MVIDFAEILHDLELKRAAALPCAAGDHAPRVDATAAGGQLTDVRATATTAR